MTAVPILLIGGYLGAGKTTLINRLLQEAEGRRIAAIVNDFGSIDIDAALLASASDSLVSLKNGCICCSLQGDLLRSLATVIRRDPRPDAIVIETSGISDPTEIIRSLLDPVIFKAAALETVLTLVDAAMVTDEKHLWDDPLWISQGKSADALLVTKADLIARTDCEALSTKLSSLFFPKPVVLCGDRLPMELMFSPSLGARVIPPARPHSPGFFATVSWTSSKPLSPLKFQAALEAMSRRLLRAKGIVAFVGRETQPLLFQLVGSRATLTPSPIAADDRKSAAIVLIGRAGAGDLSEVTALLDKAVT